MRLEIGGDRCATSGERREIAALADIGAVRSKRRRLAKLSQMGPSASSESTVRVQRAMSPAAQHLRRASPAAGDGGSVRDNLLLRVIGGLLSPPIAPCFKLAEHILHPSRLGVNSCQRLPKPH